MEKETCGGGDKSELTVEGTSGILKEQNTSKNKGASVRYVGKLDKKLYSCVTEDISTDEVVITDERIKHIQERHPGNYEKISPFLQEALEVPDYILEDKNPNTALILKRVEVNGQRIQVVLRLHTSTDIEGFKNSIISAWEISENRWKNYITNKIILYKF